MICRHGGHARAALLLPRLNGLGDHLGQLSVEFGLFQRPSGSRFLRSESSGVSSSGTRSVLDAGRR